MQNQNKSIRSQMVAAYDENPLALSPNKLIRAIGNLKRRLEWLDVRISIKEEKGEPSHLDREEAGSIRIVLETLTGGLESAETLGGIESKHKEHIALINRLESKLGEANNEVNRLRRLLQKNTT